MELSITHITYIFVYTLSVFILGTYYGYIKAYSLRSKKIANAVFKDVIELLRKEVFTPENIEKARNERIKNHVE